MTETEIKPSEIDKFGENKHELTIKDSRKGGRATKETNPTKVLNRMKYCSKKCPIFPCFMSAIALADPEHKCVRLKTESSTWDMITKIMLGGREGWEKAYRGIIAKIASTEKEMDFIKDFDRAFRTLYGEKQEIQATGNTITIFDLITAFNKKKEEDNGQNKQSNQDRSDGNTSISQASDKEHEQ